MAIKMKLSSDYENSPSVWAPVIHCDVCGEEIADGRAGVYLWDIQASVATELSFACKGACHEQLEKRIESSGAVAGWHELYAFVGCLKGNVMRESSEAAHELADEAELVGT